MLKSVIFIVLSVVAASAQDTEVLTNEKIIKMVQRGVPAATIVKSIEGAGLAVDFLVTGPALQRLTQAKIPQGVLKAMAASLEQVRAKAEQGEAAAQFNVGLMYRDGKDVPQDLPEAVRWFRKAAEQGLDSAQVNLGVMYYFGQGVAQDYAEAARWYRKAAEQELSGAQFNLGKMYAKGQGVPQDFEEAVQWIRSAANWGLPDARFSLGQMYADGQGVPKDSAEAVRWFRMAADQGLPEAQINLGVMYYTGEGVVKDDVQAYMWFDVASSRVAGDLQAKYRDGRDKIAAKLTPQQLAKAKSLARAWKPSGF